MDAIWTFLMKVLTMVSPPYEVIPVEDVRGAGKRKTVVLRDGYKQVVIDQRKQVNRNHTLNHLDDFISYARRAARPERATIFCAPGSFVLVLDDGDGTPLDGSTEPTVPGAERIGYQPTMTEQALTWLRKLPDKFTHLALKKFIESHLDDIDESHGLLGAVAQFSAQSGFTYAGNIGRGGERNISFAIKTGLVDGTVELPTEFTIKIPVYEGWPQTYTYRVRLDWEMVTGGDKTQPVFFLEVVGVEVTQAFIIEELTNYTREQLGEGWLVVRGKPQMKVGDQS